MERGQGLALSTVPPHRSAPLGGVGEALSRLIPYPESRSSLQIPRVDGEYDLKMPRDMAYVFSGAYVPLSCKIIEQVRPPVTGVLPVYPPTRQPASGASGGVPLPRAGVGSAPGGP